jgi:hypothetical protein
LSQDRRSATAGAFQVVELMACVREILASAARFEAGEAWRAHAENALRQLEQILAEIRSGRPELGGRSAFRKYQDMVADLSEDETEDEPADEEVVP